MFVDNQGNIEQTPGFSEKVKFTITFESQPEGEEIVDDYTDGRGLVVGQLYSIITYPEKTQELIDFIKKYEFKELTLYTGGPVQTRVLPGREILLKAFLEKVRAEGISFVSVAVGSKTQVDTVIKFSTDYGVKIDGLWLEYEFWNNSPRDFSTNAVGILKHMREQSPPDTTIGAYIGWLNQGEMDLLVTYVDRIYMHTYVDSGDKLYSRMKSRLDMIKNSAPKTKVKVFPLVSAEWRPPEICNAGRTHPDYNNKMCFLGPWLKANGAFKGAEYQFSTDMVADADLAWRDYVEICSFYVYSYQYALEALGPAQPDSPIEENAMSFSDALFHIKGKFSVARKDWLNQFIFLVPGSAFEVSRYPLNTIFPEGTEINYLPHIDIKLTDNTIVPWNPTQADLMANDWYIVKDLGLTGN